MSRRVPTKEALMRWVDDVAERDDLDAREALLLTKFAAYADADFTSWAKIETLMRQGRSGERKVQYMLRDFEARGYIRRTGRMHALEGSGREVPIYVWCGFLGDFQAEGTGAQRAPERAQGCTDGGGTGAQGVHPQIEPIEPTSPDGEGARAQASGKEEDFERVFVQLEAAFPSLGLAATFRDRAKVALRSVLAEGVPGEALVAAAGRYAADKAWKRKDLGLDHWLHDRRFRHWLPQPELALDAGAAAAPAAEGPPALPSDVANVVYTQGRDWVASWLRKGEWREAGRVLVCALAVQRDEVVRRLGARLGDIGVTVACAKDLQMEGVG